MRSSTLLLALALLALATSLASADVMLVNDGQSTSTIVIREAADGPIKAAADALQGYIEQMSGAKLPIASDAEPVQGPRILIGSSKGTTGIKEDLSEERLGYDGCVARTLGKDLVFLGPRDAGAANGVYWFLEWKLGVHRFGLRDDALVVPKKKAVSVKDFYYAHKPSFAWRASWISLMSQAFSAEEIANHGKYLDLARRGGVSLSGAHSLEYLVPRTLFDQHPEYFPLINGQRTPHGQLCLSNPGVLETVVNALKSQPPDSQAFNSVSPNDEPGWCECSDCMRMAKDPAARMMLFCNQVVERLEPTHPKLGACFLAYTYSETMEPPLGLKAHPRVVPLIAPLGACVTHSIDSKECPDAAELRRVCEGWRQVAEKVTTYPYIYGEAVPLPTPAAVARELKYYNSIGLFGMQREHMSHGFGWELSQWLEWQLLWDAEQDVDKLRTLFFDGYYGAAAEPMKRLYERIEAAVESTPVGQKGLGGDPNPPHPFFARYVQIPPGYTNCAANIAASLEPTLPDNARDIREALRLADTPAARAHVQLEADYLSAITTYIRARLAYQRWKPSQLPLDTERARRSLTLAIARLKKASATYNYIAPFREYLEKLRAQLPQQ